MRSIINTLYISKQYGKKKEAAKREETYKSSVDEENGENRAAFGKQILKERSKYLT